MKKRNLVCLFSALMLFGINSVSAADFKVGDKFQIQKEKYVDASGFTFGGYNYNDKGGELKNYITNQNEKFVVYCEDPSRPGGNNYKVERILGTNKQQEHINAFDNGMLAILSKGYNQYNNSLRTDSGLVVSGDDLYLATSIAQRAFVYANVFNYSEPELKGYYETKAKGILNVAIRWASMYYGDVGTYSSNNAIKNCTNQKCVESTLKSRYTWYDASINLTPAGNGSKSYNVILAAQYLFKLGVKAQSEYTQGLTNQFSITATINGSGVAGKVETPDPDKSFASIVTIDENDNTKKQYMYATIEVKNLVAQTGYINNIQIDCPTCSADGVTLGALEYSIDSGDWQTLPAGLNVAQYLKEENGLRNGKIGIRFAYESKSDSDDCNGTDFTLNYDYFNTGNDVNAIALRSLDSTSKVRTFQRYLAIIKSAGNSKGTAKGNLGCGTDNACETELQIPICSDNEEEAVAKVKAPDNIKKCILNKKDDANNKYQLVKENGGLVKEDDKNKEVDENRYCDIFCKEDYAEIKLNPIIEEVVCGGYFQLKSKVSGTKTCYTGNANTTDSSTNGKSSIDKEKFLNDIIEAQKMMIEAVTKYNEAKAAKDAFDPSGKEDCEETDEDGEVTDTWTSYYADFEYEKLTVDSRRINYSTGYVPFYTTTKSESYGEYEDMNPRCHKEGEGEDRGYVDGDSDAITDRYEALFDEADALYEKGSELYEAAIKNYNACTTGWINNFKFVQQIKYYYDESRYEDEPYTGYYELIKEANNQSKEDEDGNTKDFYYLEAVDKDVKTKSTITICTGKADDQYNCIDGQTITLDGNVDDGKHRLDSYSYNEDYGSDVFKISSFTYCDLKHGCKETQQAISQASFVKKTVDKEQSYITPTTFYQIAANGKITVKSGYDGDKLQLAALENALPVSTSAVGGGKFRLMLQGLGEFYDAKDKYGRLIDYTLEEGLTEGSVAYAQNQNGIETTFDGDYKCYYKSSCRPKDCPNCDFICDDDVCEWKECPDCKFTCVNCVFNLDELKLNVKTISTTNFDSVGRTFGYNWITSSSMKALELLNSKASKTISEIKETNEMVYQDDKTSEDSSLAFSVKMTPEVTREILKWNEAAKGKGGYLDSSLTCYDAVIDGQTYKNIYCYSKNIDTLVENFSDEVTVNNRPKTDAERKNYTKYKESDKGYWTLWDGFLTLNKNEVGSAVKSDAETGETYQVLGGPSWK